MRLTACLVRSQRRRTQVAGLALLGLVALMPLVSGLPDSCLKLTAVVASGAEVKLRGATALHVSTARHGTGPPASDRRTRGSQSVPACLLPVVRRTVQ